MDELVGLLSRERLLLELLLFKLVELRQLLLAGEARFLAWGADEVDRATASVREAELRRAVVVARLADEQGLPVEALSLRVLAEASPEPWATIFADHRAAFLRLAAEIEDTLAATRRLAGAGSRAVAETLDRIGGAGSDPPALADGTYGPGAALSPALAAPRVQRSL